MIEHKFSNKKRFRYIFIIIDSCSKFTWAIPLKYKNALRITIDFSNILTAPKRSPIKTESNRGKDFYNSIFQNLI